MVATVIARNSQYNNTDLYLLETWLNVVRWIQYFIPEICLALPFNTRNQIVFSGLIQIAYLFLPMLIGQHILFVSDSGFLLYKIHGCALNPLFVSPELFCHTTDFQSPHRTKPKVHMPFPTNDTWICSRGLNPNFYMATTWRSYLWYNVMSLLFLEFYSFVAFINILQENKITMASMSYELTWISVHIEQHWSGNMFIDSEIYIEILVGKIWCSLLYWNHCKLVSLVHLMGITL